ncbi:MAG TPA: hypothetical protein VF142_13680 [Longimicrobium sp.]
MNKENKHDGDGPRDPLIDTIRERVNAYITGAPGHDVLSLREMARRIGMSVGGLHKFAGGAMPYTATRRKLLRWYNSLTPATRDEQKRDGLALLLSDIPEDRRGDAERSILQIISGYEDAAAAAAPAPRPGARRGRKRKVVEPPA